MKWLKIITNYKGDRNPTFINLNQVKYISIFEEQIRFDFEENLSIWFGIEEIQNIEVIDESDLVRDILTMKEMEVKK